MEIKIKELEEKIKQIELNSDIQLLNLRQSPLPTPETTTIKDFHLCQEKLLNKVDSFECLN